jgi:hypothetical protein
MEPNFDNMDLFCRINVQTQMPFLEFAAFIARCAGGSSHMNAIRAKTLDISVFENDDFDAELSRTGADRWLYFRYTLEADPSDGVLPKDYVAAIGALLNSLWSSRMDAIAACDFEEQLPQDVRRLQWARTPRPDRAATGTEVADVRDIVIPVTIDQVKGVEETHDS